jgi:NAD(P)H-dependent FMN reductase
VGSFDAYVFVTPEYNHGTSGALKNAIDFLFAEWNNKAAGFVSYGGASGARAVEQLRLNLAEVQMATVRNQVLLSMYTDFENFSVFKPGPTKEQSVNDMLDQLIAWGSALKTLRKASARKEQNHPFSSRGRQPNDHDYFIRYREGCCPSKYRRNPRKGKLRGVRRIVRRRLC